MKTIQLEPGHSLIDGNWTRVTASIDPGQTSLQLDGVILRLEDQADSRGKPREATTLAIRMDREAAMALAGDLVDLGRTMGWRLPLSIESQA